jgi:hypothetical protein
MRRKMAEKVTGAKRKTDRYQKTTKKGHQTMPFLLCGRLLVAMILHGSF